VLRYFKEGVGKIHPPPQQKLGVT